MKSRGGKGSKTVGGSGGGGNSGGGGGSAPHLPQSSRSLAAIATFNVVMRDAQQQIQPVAGGATCESAPLPGRTPTTTTGPRLFDLLALQAHGPPRVGLPVLIGG